MAGQTVVGAVEVHLRGNNNGAEVPKLQGNKSTMDFPLAGGIAHVQVKKTAMLSPVKYFFLQRIVDVWSFHGIGLLKRSTFKTSL